MKESLFLLVTLWAVPFAIAQRPPAQAVNAGYTHLAFGDEFNSPKTVSPDGTGNYNWYRTNFYSPSLTLPASGYSIQDGFLALYTDTSGYSNGLQTADPQNTVQAWQHGYFEARILFCQFCSQGSAWPAFWSSSIDYVTGQVPINSPYAELDFMEYYTQDRRGTYETNIHQIINTTPFTQTQNANDIPKIPPFTDFGLWHTYGCLWTPNQVQWYFENKLVTTVATGPGTPFTALEQSKMFLILGTGAKWPMFVDYVHVWQ